MNRLLFGYWTRENDDADLELSTAGRAIQTTSASWLLSACAEAKGKQDLWIRQKPEVLEALRRQAIVQSVESSN